MAARDRSTGTPDERLGGLDLDPVLRAASAGKILFDLAGDRLIWDDRSLEIFGLSEGEFGGNYAAWERMVHPDDLERVQGEVEAALATASVVDLRYRIRRTDGEVRDIWAVGAIDRDDSGAAIRVTGIHLDETELRRSRGASSLIYDAIADAVFAVHMPSRKISYVNRPVSEMFGYDVHEVLGSTTRLFYANDEDYEAFGARLQRAFLAGERQVRAEQRLVTKSGEPLWASIVTTFFTEDGQLTAVISVIRDISNERKLEKQLQQALKLEAVGQLAGGVAHDMNNVLAAIMVAAELLDGDLAADHPGRNDLDGILSAARRGKALVENLLGFARQGDYTSRPLQMDAEVRGALELLRHSLPKTIDFQTELSAPGAHVQGDGVQLSQTVLNLCINARDAIAEAGSIRVRTTRVRLDAGEHPELEAGDYYLLQIVDDGHGMPAEVAHRAFEPFFTTKEVGRGSGLGLSMAYGVMQNHGGAIAIESEPGRGTVVSCWIPLIEAPEPAAADETVPETDQARPTTVMLVDDEELLLRTTKRGLERLGYQVLDAAGGEAALEVFAESREWIDVVLLDMSMPRMSGAECFGRLKAIDPHVPVVICTGHGDPDTAHTMLREGARAVLTKPYPLATLHEVLSAHATRR